MNRIQSTALTTQNITSALLTATYTADADKELLIHLSASGLAGNGVYRACVTKQVGGTGAVYQSPTTTAAVANTVTTLFMPTISIAVESTDVVKVYLQGLAGDTSVAIVTEVYDVQAVIPWNAAWDSEIESEVNDALVVLKLDHLVAVADADDVANDSVIAKLVSKAATADWSSFANTTDSLEANRDNIGSAGVALTSVALADATSDAVIADAAWNAAKASYGTTGTYGEHLEALANSSDPSAATIADAVWDELSTGHTNAGKAGEQLWTNIGAPSDLGNGASLAANIADTYDEITGLNDLSAVQVNAEVVDVLSVDTWAEPGQEAPAATNTLVKKIGYLFKMLRNKKTQTATTRSLYNDAGDTVDQVATDSDDGTTFSKGEYGSGA